MSALSLPKVNRTLLRAILITALALGCCWKSEALTVQTQNSGTLLIMSNLNVTLQYDLTSGQGAFYWQNQKIIAAFYSGAGLSTGYIKGTNYASWTYALVSSNQVMITATGKGHPIMKQFFTFDQTNSFLARCEMDGTNLSGNWMGPIVVDTVGGVDIGSYGDDRALLVPFDNDAFVRYNALPLNSTNEGYEAGAFYDNVSRNGLVVGSVTHDTWKTGIYWQGSGNKLTLLNVFGGANSSYTHDVVAHGSLVGNTISSPTVFVGFFPDWRAGMAAFTAENLLMAPRLTWTNGVPFGWNSWGVIQTAINYTDATNASIFIKNNLQASNFNNGGTVYINLDSYWSDLSPSQIQSWVNLCHANGQKAGLYFTPFAYWGSASQAQTQLVPGSTYTYSQVLLQNGSGGYETNDGALVMDPTHPGTQACISYYINEFTNWGVDYVKIDFLTHGSMEGVHYNTNVYTGIQAYNIGMQYLFNQVNGKMFISESIAPLFPYQYAHSRRIACDAGTSKISNTEYTLNSVSYGWWLGQLYDYNDPDIMVFDGLTTNENQSRLINCAITGVFLDGDSFTNASSQSAAISNLTNAAINAVARMGQTFLPVEGNTGSSASTLFTGWQGSNSYLAVFNYSTNPSVTNINLTRAGISGAVGAVDLWSSAVVPVTNNSMTVSLNGAQARLFRMVGTSSLQSPQLIRPGVFGFTITGNAGFLYSIQSSTNLATWTTVGAISNAAGSVAVQVTNAANRAGGSFYRSVLVP